MRKFNKFDCFTYAQAAASLGVAVWRLRYAVDSGYLPRPGVVFKRRAMFSPGQIDWMRAYFNHIRRGPDQQDTCRSAGRDEGAILG